MDGGDTRLPCQSPRGERVVAGEHRGLDAERGELPDGLGSLGPEFVADGDRSDQNVGAFDEYHGGTAALQTSNIGAKRVRAGVGVEPARLSEPDVGAVEGSGQAVSGDGNDIIGCRDGRYGGQDGAGERMLAASFERSCNSQRVVAADSRSGDDVDDLGCSCGQGAGLVQRDDADAAQLFHCCAAFDQRSVAARGTDGRDHRQRHRDGQRAR